MAHSEIENGSHNSEHHQHDEDHAIHLRYLSPSGNCSDLSMLARIRTEELRLEALQAD
jgi:hypothetical protein